MTTRNRSDLEGDLLVVVGPTAVGKTALSLQLAREFDGEIISADSRLFYVGMDIGTAKPTAEERAAVAHHLVDICLPDEPLTLGQYQRLAYQTINEVISRNRLPILVGGTGQYVKAVVEGWGIPEIAPNRALRRQLELLGGVELARWLRLLDPLAAQRIDPRNTRRVVRALEVTLISGQPITKLQRKEPPPYDIMMIGLHRDRPLLYERIDQRVDLMMEAGLLEEVSKLHARGYHAQLPAMSGLGYRQILAYLRGEMDLPEARERIKFETHRFARQQATWFRHDDPRIQWFDVSEHDQGESIAAAVRRWLARD